MQSCCETLTTDWPISRHDNIAARAAILRQCESDLAFRKQIITLCVSNVLYFIDLFCYTKDPRRPIGEDIYPFICYPYQRDAILNIQAHIDTGHDLLIEKSRDMGASWMILYVFLHKWLFEPGSDFRVGSRKEEYVDKINDIDTLIEKVRFTIKRLPLWMLPEGFDYDKHLGFMRIVNPENNNTIIGESANPHFSSGGRRKAILMDEFSKWENSVAEAAWTATADASPCRLVCSTPVGSGNKFGQLALGTQETIDKLTLFWALHPEKNKNMYYLSGETKIPVLEAQGGFNLWRQGIEVRSDWYDIEKARRSEQDLAQEINIDYLRSGHVFFDSKAIARQKEWTYQARAYPGQEIPRGKFFRVNLVDIDGKIELRDHAEGWLKIYELPYTGYQYTLGSDIAEGLAKSDESVIVIRDKSTRNVMAVANGLYNPDDMVEMIRKASKYYNNALSAPENNNHGYSVVSDLKKTDCNLYSTKTRNEKGEVTSTKAGWTTTPRSRPQMLDQLSEELRKDAVELRDPILIQQCRTFVMNPNNGKPEADEGLLDDAVLATAIAGAVIQEYPYKANTSDTKEKMKARVHELNKPMYSYRSA